METGKYYGQCRCCYSNGYHKNIMKEYIYEGKREVYYDMFAECFNLFLTSNTKVSFLICSSCVDKLRAANEFKSLVVDAESKLLAVTSEKDTIFVNVPTNRSVLLACEVKVESDIKQEHDEDYMSDVDCGPVVYDDGNDETSSFKAYGTDQEMVPGEAELIARFAFQKPQLPNRHLLHKICPGFVRYLDMFKDKVVTAKSIEKMLQEHETKRKYYNQLPTSIVTEKIAHITNASILIEFSNMTPFKSKSRTGFPCFYCKHNIENLEKLIEHQAVHHKKSDAKKVLGTYGSEALVVYADVTDLKCTICNVSVPNISELKTHLIRTHDVKMYTDYPDRVIPYKLSNNNVFDCQICGFMFETFGSVERHMNVHYRNYVCKECGAGFITKYRLKVHTKSMHTAGEFLCELCKKVYTSQQKLKNHIDAVHRMVKRFKCLKCPERFSEYFGRQKHMVSVHGVAPLQYKCNVCDKAFDRRYTLSRHMKRDHLEERDYQCDMCTYTCFTSNELRVHMVKHNGERIFECAVCKKAYARKKTLKEHMRIHNNDRRFVCAVCGQAFVQKCSLKGHIKTHHVEYSVPI